MNHLPYKKIWVQNFIIIKITEINISFCISYIHVSYISTEYIYASIYICMLYTYWEVEFLGYGICLTVRDISIAGRYITVNLGSGIEVRTSSILGSKVVKRGRSEDGRGIGQGDHFLPYKFIERTIERWANFTKQLLTASRRFQAEITQKSSPSSLKGGRTKYKWYKETQKS